MEFPCSPFGLMTPIVGWTGGRGFTEA